MQLITHSRQACFKECRRRHWFAYELALRPVTDARALRMGHAFHAGLEALPDLDKACHEVRSVYVGGSPWAGEQAAYEWAIECETILRLVCAYQWRWQEAKLEVVATEQTFELELENPATGAGAKHFRLAGKIDGIVKLEDGRLAVKETKTTSDDIGPDANLWRRLRMDQQISLYIYAARKLGFAVDTVLYDVIRKPAIKPTLVPLLDEHGMKIVLDAQGVRVQNKPGQKYLWRQTADVGLGHVLQVRSMTAEEWGEKLTADIVSQPDRYFARVEIPRLDQDIEDYQGELWQLQQSLREAQRTGKWYRTVSRQCEFCPYFEPCSSRIDARSEAPAGFQFVSNVHPELHNGNSTAE